MEISSLLVEIFGRIPGLVGEAVEGLDADRLSWRPAPDANTIGWLAWHIGRVQDSQVADITGEDQVWLSGTWAHGFGLDPDASNTGYGHSSEQVGQVNPEGPDVLVGYVDAVHSRVVPYLRSLRPDDLDRIVDSRWDPPVTLGVRLVSIADDCLQHAGQAAYVRGLLGA